jgi:hypothetical protein
MKANIVSSLVQALERSEKALEEELRVTRNERDALNVRVEEEIQRWRNACELMNKAEAERDALRGLLMRMRDGPPHLYVWQWLPRIAAALAKGEKG